MILAVHEQVASATIDSRDRQRDREMDRQIDPKNKFTKNNTKNNLLNKFTKHIHVVTINFTLCAIFRQQHDN